MVYSTNHMLCCVMVSDGEGSIILLKHLNAVLQIGMPCRQRFFLYKNIHMFEKKIFVQLIVVVACD